MTEAQAREMPPLVYADWLDEHGRPLEAELERIDAALAELPAEESPSPPSVLGLMAKMAFPFGGGLWAQRAIDRYKAAQEEWAERTARRRRLAARRNELIGLIRRTVDPKFRVEPRWV